MANKRMFSKDIVNSSKFLKMPATSRLLYYDLGMNADDDGFAEHFMVIKMTGASQQDLGVLEINGFIKVFDENVLIIVDWKTNNEIKKDRYKPSQYLSVYSLDTICIQDGYKTEPQVRLGKVRLGKDREEESREDQEGTPPTAKKKFVKPTVEEIKAYCEERKNGVDPERFFAFYESKGWKVGNQPMKNWRMSVITWEKRMEDDKGSGTDREDNEPIKYYGTIATNVID